MHEVWWAIMEPAVLNVASELIHLNLWHHTDYWGPLLPHLVQELGNRT